MKRTFGFFALASLLAVGVTLFDSTTSQAQNYRSRYGNFGRSYRNQGYYAPQNRGYYAPRSGPIYHQPSVHYDRVYHPTRLHWTPRRGLHTHGHYDIVPHYVPGHFDYQHRGHVHPNPRYHH